MKCVRRGDGAHRPAASIPSRSPSSGRTPPGDRSRPDPRGGRARLSLVLPALALLLGALGLFVAAPAKAQLAGGDLISNTGQSVSVQEAVFRDAAQSFTTGSDPEGYTLTGVDLVLQHTSTTAPVYDVNIYTDSSGRPSILIGPLNSPSSLPSAVNGVARYTAEGDGIALSADTTYWVVFDVVVQGTGTVARALTQSTAEDSGAAKGWSIGNGRLHRDHNASTWLSSPHSMKMALHGIDGDSVTHHQVKVSDFQVDTVTRRIRVKWHATNDRSSLCCGYLIAWLRKTNVHQSWYDNEFDSDGNRNHDLFSELVQQSIPLVGKWRSEKYFDSGHRPAYVVGYGAEDSGCVADDGSLRDIKGYLLPGLEYEVRVSVLGPPGEPARLVYSTTATTVGDVPYWARPYSESQQRRPKPGVSPPPPALESARVSRAALSLVFDVDLDESSVPSGSAFAVTAAGAARAVSSVAVSGRTVTLTLAEAVVAGDTVTVGYTLPATGKLRHAEGPDSNVAAFSGQAVSNATLAGAPLTASIKAAPSEHRGKGKFTLRIAFSDPVAGTIKATAVRVEGGGLVRLRRVQRRADLWELGIRPSSNGPVTVTLAAGSARTANGRKLGSALTHTVPGPPGLSVADASAQEGAGATVDFAVTLARAASGAVTVRYATKNGTAKAGKDYRRAKGTLTFAAGETSKTVSVPVLDDAHDEGTGDLHAAPEQAEGRGHRRRRGDRDHRELGPAAEGLAGAVRARGGFGCHRGGDGAARDAARRGLALHAGRAPPVARRLRVRPAAGTGGRP